MESKQYLSNQSCNKLLTKKSTKNTVLFFIIICLLLPACSKRMSLEEAKEVPVSISGKTFVPPPRRIDDVTKILDQNPPDPATVERLIAIADATPPATASKVKLQDFYYQRGMAAKKLTTGLFRQQKKDPKLSRARALRKSMLELIDGPGLKDAATGKIVASYAHPLFWAPFVIVGEGGNTVD